MSQTPDGKQFHSKHAIIRKTYTSTPNHNISVRRYSVSLSTIDTGSSSSGGKICKKLHSQIPEKRKKHLKTRKAAKKSRRVVFQSKDSDSEWETKSEESIKVEWETKSIKESLSLRKSETNDDSSAHYVNLFESARSPEKIRNVPITREEILYGSPVIRFSRRSRPVSKDFEISQQDQLLPVHLPTTERHLDEDEWIFHRETNMKTYAFARKQKRKSPKIKLGDFMFPVKVPTLISNQLWNEFIRKHYGKTSHYLANLSARDPDGLTSSTSQLSNAPEKLEIDAILPDVECIQAHGKKDSQGWESRCIFKHKLHKLGRKDEEEIRRKRRKEETSILPSARRPKADVYQFDKADMAQKLREIGNDNVPMSLSEFRREQSLCKISKLTLTSSESSTE